MAKIQRLKDISGNVIYPKTTADAVMYDNENTMRELASNSLYMSEDDGLHDEVDNIDADTLQGHSSDYFASKQDLNDEKTALNNRIDNVNNSIDEINKELSNIETGSAGKSAYEYAKEGGYTGTEEEFAIKLNTEYIKTETDPTVPAWAKEPTKPSYAYSEIINTPDLGEIAAKDKIGMSDLSQEVRDALTSYDIPSSLPNPHKLTFTGAVQGEYDGSAAKTINIPTIDTSDIEQQIGALSAEKIGMSELDAAIANIDIPTKVSQLTNDKGYLTEHQSLKGYAKESYVDTKISEIPTPDVSGQINTHNTDTSAHADIRQQISQLSSEIVDKLEPTGDDIPKVFLTGNEFSNMTNDKNEVNMEMDYRSKTKQFHAYIAIKFQGNTSLRYDKKNFTVKLFDDEAHVNKQKHIFRDWKYAKHKFVLKANYIDHSHARNIIGANLWNEVVGSRIDYDNLPEELRNSPKNGAIDGFPIKLYVNGTYQGVYTWNIGKDDWMWGMDEDNANHILLCVEHNSDGEFKLRPYNFRALWNGTDGYFEVEIGNATNAKTSINNLISFVMNNDGTTFRDGIGAYLDIQSAIDYYIHMYLICGLDGLAKNMLLGTYDGKKWYCGAYDMDSTFGLFWNGSYFISPTYKCPEDYCEKFNLLWERFESNFWTEIKNRYAELRKTVYSTSNMFTHFERFMDTIGLDLYAEDLEIYTSIPCSSTNNIKQLRNFIRDRLVYCDQQITNGVPATAITLSKTEISLSINETVKLTSTVIPSNTTDEILWLTSDSTIATVSGGTVKGLVAGNCDIRAKCGSGYAVCAVTVAANKTYYAITNNLTNSVNANSATSVEEGTSYSATITANSGYKLDTVKVTMGGTDITSSAYSNGVITIASVTGNVVITANAVLGVAYTNLVDTALDLDTKTFTGTTYKIDHRVSSTGVIKSGAGGEAVCLGYMKVTSDATVRVKGVTLFDGTENSNTAIALFKSDFTHLGTACMQGTDYTEASTTGIFGPERKSPITDISNGITTIKLPVNSDIYYLVVSGVGTGANAIVTCNEEIT